MTNIIYNTDIIKEIEKFTNNKIFAINYNSIKFNE